MLTYGYNSGADAAVGRVSYLADSDSTHLVDYYYLGLGQIDDVSSPQPGIDYNLGHKTATANLDRVDQFNRATDQVFAEIGARISTRSSTALMFPAIASGRPSRPPPATASTSTSCTATTR